MKPPLLRLAIACDRPLFREGLRAALGGQKGIEVVGVAGDFRGLASLCARRRPDVAIVTPHLPPRGGAAAIADLLGRFPALRTVLLLTGSGGEELPRAIRAGVRGCLTRDTSLPECVRILRSVQAGRIVIPSSGPG